MLTEAIALEYADAGVRVFGLAPGVVDTDMQATIRITAAIPARRSPTRKATGSRGRINDR
jgi:NAD(P)-dependent dehydrogenase (short-subunit alcohol dehydrogenase family)